MHRCHYKAGLYVKATPATLINRMQLLFNRLLLAMALMAQASLFGALSSSECKFTVVKQRIEPQSGQPVYYFSPMLGIEQTNNSLNRLSIVSENQFDYPIPESGCAPTAMLNILIWYEKYGLIEPKHRDSDARQYKYKFFLEIDHRLAQQAGRRRNETLGINSADVAIVMDLIVSERSTGAVRIHTDTVPAPLELTDLLEGLQNFRASYLIVTPKNPHTGTLGVDHAVVVIRADSAGYITLATWGKRYRGLLKTRSDGQWFIPQGPSHLELKINELMRFIPFRPTTPVGH